MSPKESTERYAKEKMECSFNYSLNDFITDTIHGDEDYESSVSSLLRYIEIIHIRYVRRMGEI